MEEMSYHEDTLRKLLKRRNRLEKKIKNLGPIMRGTISSMTKTYWSTTSKTGTGKKTYYYFSYYKDKKNKMKAIRKKHVKEVKEMMANYKELTEIVKKMTEVNADIINIRGMMGDKFEEKIMVELQKENSEMRK